MATYTADQIRKNLSLKQMLYQKKQINYAGKTKKDSEEGGIYYTEIISKYVLDKDTVDGNGDVFKLWDIDLRDDFSFNDHEGLHRKTNRKEENLCKELYAKCVGNEKRLNTLGKPINYQVNIIKNTKVNVDLITISNDRLYLVEVKGHIDEHQSDEKTKKYLSEETLLRAMLEIESYYRLLARPYNSDFHITGLSRLCKTLGSTHYSPKNNNLSNFTTDKIAKAILVPKASRAWAEYEESQSGERENLKKLLDIFQIEVFCFENEGLNRIIN